MRETWSSGDSDCDRSRSGIAAGVNEPDRERWVPIGQPGSGPDTFESVASAAIHEVRASLRSPESLDPRASPRHILRARRTAESRVPPVRKGGFELRVGSAGYQGVVFGLGVRAIVGSAGVTSGRSIRDQPARPASTERGTPGLEWPVPNRRPGGTGRADRNAGTDGTNPTGRFRRQDHMSEKTVTRIRMRS